MAVYVAEFILTLCVIQKCWWTWWVLRPRWQGKTEVFGEKFAPVPHGLPCEECGSWSQSCYSKALDGSALSLHVKISSENIAWELRSSPQCYERFFVCWDVALYSCGHVYLTFQRISVPSAGMSACSPLCCHPRCLICTTPTGLHVLCSFPTLITHSHITQPVFLSGYSFCTTKPWRWRQYDPLKGRKIP